MANDQPAPYDEHDYGVIANAIFTELCLRDKDDRIAGRDPAWHNLRELVRDRLGAYRIENDVQHLAEDLLQDERGFIERDPHSLNIRLTRLGRENCNIGIDVPPSTHQIRTRL
jgi:hypothetical protein